MRAAIPKYLQEALNRLGGATPPPGHAFRLYFLGYDHNWQIEKAQKAEILTKLAKLSDRTRKVLEAVCHRQEHLAKTKGAWQFSGWAKAPFTAGLGNEHPLENGFSFLDPYGIPYYPGASVKGVVRRAAEELALFEQDPCGWTLPAVWWLFGFDLNAVFFREPKGSLAAQLVEETNRWRKTYRERIAGLDSCQKELFDAFVETTAGPDPKDREALRQALQEGRGEPLKRVHSRGAFTFWDVIPELPQGGLRVDIMNPHYGHYYQGQDYPGDWGSPGPIFYLTLPEGTRFRFVVEFVPPTSWPEVVRKYFDAKSTSGRRWQELLQAAFEFAFEWLGFGAKTSIGYGRFQQSERFEPPKPKPVTSEQLGHHHVRQQVKSPGVHPNVSPPVPPSSSGPTSGSPSRSALSEGFTLIIVRPKPFLGGSTSGSNPVGSVETVGTVPGGGLEEQVRSFDFASAGMQGLRALLSNIAALQDEKEKERLVKLLRLPNEPRVRVVFTAFPDLAKYRG